MNIKIGANRFCVRKGERIVVVKVDAKDVYFHGADGVGRQCSKEDFRKGLTRVGSPALSLPVLPECEIEWLEA